MVILDRTKLDEKTTDAILDLYERYRLMAEVFFQHIPDNQKIIVLSEAADRIWNEITEPNKRD